jgi:hypothetical protein
MITVRILCLSAIMVVGACSGSKTAIPATGTSPAASAGQVEGLIGKWTRTFSFGTAQAVARLEFRSDRVFLAEVVLPDRTLSNTATWSVSNKKVTYSNQNCSVSMGDGKQSACNIPLADNSFEVQGDTLTMSNILADGGMEPQRTYTRVK